VERRPPQGGGPALDALGGLDVAGLSWLHHRAYDPGTRQFLSPDPLPGVPGSPVATNPYHYAGNDPVGCVDPLGLQPLSIDQYNDIRKQETGVQWNNVVTVGLVAAGVLLSFTGVGAVAMIAIGAGLGAIGGAAPGIIQGATGGGWDWGNIAGGALKGAVIGGLSGGIGGGIGALTTRLGTTGGAFTTTLLTGGGRFGAGARGTVFGATNGALSGTAAEAYDVLPLPGSDGSFDPEGIAVTTVVGGGLGGGVAAGRYQPPPPPRPDFVVAPNGTTMPVSQARTAAIFDEAGLQKTPLTNAQGQPNGTQYTMPDGSRVRLMEPNATADRRASFENANGQPVDWQTGKPVQKPPPQPGQPQLSGAAWKNYHRSRTHLPRDP
jgi:RHS repeat-associated protein